MRQMSVKMCVCSLFLIFLISGCAGTKLIDTQVDKSFRGKYSSNILVIGVTYKEKENVRIYFEESFVKQLEAIGVDAVSSGEAVTIPADMMLKKQDVTAALKKYKSDAVLISFLAGSEEDEIFNRDNMLDIGYYNFYSRWYQNAYSSSFSRPKTRLMLKTFLYDVKTEKLIWSGTSQTINPDSGNQVINEVIHLVIGDFQKNQLIVTK